MAAILLRGFVWAFVVPVRIDERIVDSVGFKPSGAFLSGPFRKNQFHGDRLATLAFTLQPPPNLAQAYAALRLDPASG